MQKEPGVYISFCRPYHQKVVELLCRELTRHNVQVVWDRRQLMSNHDVGIEIENLIDSSTALVVCITSGDNHDKDRWVRREVTYAKLCKKPVIALIFPGTSDKDIPPCARNIPSIRFFDQKGKPDFQSGLRRLLEWLSRHHKISANYPRMTQNVHFGYLESLYKDVLWYLETHLIALPDHDGTPLPMMFSIPAIEPPHSDHLPSVSDEVLENLDNFYDAFDFLQNRALLAGDAGAGKTLTLMNYTRDAIIARLNDITEPLPLLASITSWPQFKDHPNAMPAWLEYETGLDAHIIEETIEAGQALLLLDDIHSLRSDGQATDLLQEFSLALQHCLEGRSIENKWLPRTPLHHNQVLISCHNDDLSALRDMKTACGVVNMLPLDDAQIESYLGQCPELVELLKTNPILEALCRQPFFLHIFATTYSNDSNFAVLKQANDPDALQARMVNDYLECQYSRLKRPVFALDDIHTLLGQLAINTLLNARSTAHLAMGLQVEIDSIDALVNPHTQAFINQMQQLQLLVQSPRKNNLVAFISPVLRNHFALPFCLQQLQADDPALQHQATWIAGQLNESRTVPLLTEVLLTSEDKTLRREAAIALGKIADSRAIDALAEAVYYDEAWIVRQKAIEALSKFDDSRACEAIFAALNDRKADVRCSALVAATTLDPPQALDALIGGLLADPDPGVQWYARHELTRHQDALLPALFDRLRETNSNLRQGPVEALAHLGKSVVFQLIQELLEGSPEIRIGVGETLGRIGEAALEPLLHMIKKYNTAEVKAMIATVLGEIKHPTSVDALMTLAHDDNPWVRVNAVIALGEAGDTRAMPTLRDLLNDTTEPFYKERICDLAAEALQKLGDSDA